MTPVPITFMSRTQLKSSQRRGFGVRRRVAIVFRKTTGKASGAWTNTCDYLIWLSKDRANLKYRACYEERSHMEGSKCEIRLRINRHSTPNE
jgi:hypothetical protein